MKTPPLILASGSPRRADLLERLGVPFQVLPPAIEERLLPAESPAEGARRMAREKATAVSDGLDQGLVLAADTLVALDGRPFGKPTDRREARTMLALLSGQAHQVCTGVAVRDIAAGRVVSGTATSTVHFLDLDPGDLDWYLGTDEWRDKAGGYGLQGAGAWLVARVEGCPSNVIGLPPHLVRALLDEVGWPLSRLLGGSP